MVSAKELHNHHNELMSEILFLKDEIHFIKNVVYQRSTLAENPFQQEKLDNYLENASQLIDHLDELEINSKSIEHKVKELVQSRTVESEDPVFKEVKGLNENLLSQSTKLKNLKKELFKLN